MNHARLQVALLTSLLFLPGNNARPGMPPATTAWWERSRCAPVRASRLSLTYGIHQNVMERLVRGLREPITTFYRTEHAQSILHLPAFYIDQHEVTND
jgi:hypothetical protein